MAKLCGEKGTSEEGTTMDEGSGQAGIKREDQEMDDSENWRGWGQTTSSGTA
jgi:hypothetical protein